MINNHQQTQSLWQQGTQNNNSGVTKIERVNVVATSSVVPKIELQQGLNKLSELGFDYSVAENILAKDFAYAGTVDERATAFYQAAISGSEVIWAVRGGYGAIQLLEKLKILTAQYGVPDKKLLIGYSDITALYQFVSEQWGWDILHASMVSSKDFQLLYDEDKRALLNFIDKRCAKARWDGKPLTWVSQVPKNNGVIKGQLYGGNLAVICSLLGTPWQLDFANKILFLEEIGESWSKIDRMLHQLYLSGSLASCKAIVLGKFIDCRDAAPKGLISANSDDLSALRESLSEEQGLTQVFTSFSNLTSLPVCVGLPVGHVQQNAPLPMLAYYELSVENGLTFSHWL